MKIYRHPVDECGHRKYDDRAIATLSTSTDPAKVHPEIEHSEPTGNIELTDWTFDPEACRSNGSYGTGTRYLVTLAPDEIRAAYDYLS